MADSPSQADILARALRNGHEHDGSDCDLAVDQDAKGYVAKIHEFGYVIVAQADLLRIVREASDMRAALRDARFSMCNAHVLLSPGMRAGTAEAKAKLETAIETANSALDGQRDA